MSNNRIKSYKKGALISYCVVLVNIMAAFFYTPWMISELGSSDYALHSLAISIISLFTIDIGVGRIVSKYISKFNSENDIENANRFSGMVYKIYAVLVGLMFLILLIMYFFINQIYKGLTPEEIEKFKVVYVIVGLHSLISFEFTPLSGIFIGNDCFYVDKTISLIAKLSNIAFVILFLSLGKGLYAFVLISTFVDLSAILFRLVFCRKKCKFGGKPNLGPWNKHLFKEILGLSIWTVLITITGKLLTSLNQNILGIFSNTSQISIFSVALVFEGYCYEFSAALNGMFMPQLTDMETKNASVDEFTSLAIKVGRFQLLFVGFIMIGIISLGRGFINDVWKIDSETSFDLSYFCTIFLLLPCFFTYSMQIQTSLFYVRNKLKYLSLSYLLSAIISVILSCILTKAFPSYGALMVSIAFCSGKTVGHGIIPIILHKKVLHLNVEAFIKEVYLKCLCLFIPTLAFGLFAEYLLPIKGIIGFLFKVILVTIVYFVLCFSYGFNTFEKRFICKIVSSIFNKVSYCYNKGNSVFLINYRNSVKKNKRVAIINECDILSTGNISTLVANALNSQGFDCILCTKKAVTNYPLAYKIYSNRISYEFNHILVNLFGGDAFNNHTVTIDFLEYLTNFKPDLLFIHNLHGHYINAPLLFNFCKENKIKIVWTLHDCWLLTGRCAHFDGVQCREWLNGCDSCKFKATYPRALVSGFESLMLSRKKQMVEDQNITFVTPSYWLESMCSKTFLSQYPVVVINNGIQLKSAIKNAIDVFDYLKINKTDEYVISIASSWTYFKGLDYIFKLASNCKRSNLYFVIVGYKVSKIKKDGNLIFLPLIRDKDVIFQLLSKANLLLNPTLEDTFPTVNIESLSAGTPVLTFNTGGSPEIIDHQTGFVVSKFDVDAMSKILSSYSKNSDTIKKCKERALKFGKDKMIAGYCNLITKKTESDDDKQDYLEIKV